ncbi:MAG TPA: hypothetical protein VJB15_09140 [Rhodothermia bacterium]|nr:hypothetical protein [Rhodothermia bacterium]
MREVGRPRKPASVRRSRLVQVLVTPAHFRAFRHSATKRGQAVKDWARETLIAAAVDGAGEREIA